jgi:hypothetical protein
MDIPVFNLSNLKKSFFTFLILCIIIGVVTIFGLTTIRNSELGRMIYEINSWYVLSVFLVINFFFGRHFRNELKAIKETTDYDLKFKRYEDRYRKRLIWNGFSLLLTCFLFISSAKNFYLYLLLIQIILLPVFYPWKKIILKELGEEDIIFT